MKQLPDDFFDMVYQVVRLVPEGRVTSYGAIARYLGAARSSRMVGYAMNRAHGETKTVPAHRVVNMNGLLTGKHHFGAPDEMERRLAAEGIKVHDNQIVDFEKYYWDPIRELNIS